MSRLRTATLILFVSSLAASWSGSAVPTHAGDEAGVVDYARLVDQPWPEVPEADATRHRAALRAYDEASDPEQLSAAVRRLAALDSAVVPALLSRLPRSAWHQRAALVAAVSEMADPAVTPLLVQACDDPSFAVRVAAVAGLGKVGDERSGVALLNGIRADREPAWRVRAASATALRRACLRGAVPTHDAERALVAALEDPDQDVRLTVLKELVPLRFPSALVPVLELFTAEEVSIEERGIALDVLRGYRTPDERLVAALREGFTEWDADYREQSVLAGQALLRLVGPPVLEDEIVADALRAHLLDAHAQFLRDALARWDDGGSEWLIAEARDQAHRHAAGRARHEHDLLETVIELLIHVDRDAAIELTRELLVGPDAPVLAYETRRFIVRKARLAFARDVAAELREAYARRDDPALLPELLSAIAASGGDDVREYVTAALESDLSKLRRRALELAERLPELDLTLALAELAGGDGPVRQRATALAVLAHRAPEQAREIARGHLDHADPDLRGAAVRTLGSTGDPSDADALQERLLESFHRPEDASDPERGPEDDGEDSPASGPTTASETTRADQLRRRLRGELFGALLEVDPERLHGLAIEWIEGDAPRDVQVKAAQALVELAGPEDAERVLALLATSRGERIDRALLECLARLDSAPAAVAYFSAGVGDSARRGELLALLALPSSRVVPEGLERGLTEPGWDDADRESALALLLRADRVPPPSTLARLIDDAAQVSLAREAVLALAQHESPQAEQELLRLVAAVDRDEKLGLIVEALGRSRASSAVVHILPVFERALPAALASSVGTSPGVRLLEQCAIALGRSGDPEAGGRLASALLDPGVVTRASRHAAEVQGPFAPDAAPAVRIVRALVRGLARFEPAVCEALCAAALAEAESDGRLFGLPEAYLDGVGRYLHDPMSYRLPNRRRTRAALHFRMAVPRIAPRLSELDRDAWSAASSELSQQRRHDEALRAYRAAIAIADVEDAARTDATREWETGKLAVLEARSDAARGDEAAALARVATLREVVPTSEQLAYLQAYGFVKLGVVDDRAREAVDFAIERADWRPQAHFYRGWITERVEGVAASLPHYRAAVERDLRRVRTSSAADTVRTRAGLSHPWADYSYFLARAAARMEPADLPLVRQQLVRSIELDDRYADTALADEVFAVFEDLTEVVEHARASLPD